MRIPQPIRHCESAFNMTPMIDVVFLLIIFFLVSSHLAKQESQLPIPLPDAESGREATQSMPARVTVNVLSNGGIQVAGKRMQVIELERRLEFEYRKQQGELQVRIRSDRHVQYQFIEPIMRACTKIDIWNVQIAVIRPENSLP